MASRKENEIAHSKALLAHQLKNWGHVSWTGQARAERRARMFIEKGKIGPGTRVLELGFGTGEFTKRLAETGAEIIGIEISPDLKDFAQGEIGAASNVRLMVGDAESADVAPDASFDAVIGNGILHHIDSTKALRNAFAKLVAGGRLVFTEPNMMNPQVALQKNVPFIKRLMGESPDETAFFTWQMRKLLRQAGFVDAEVRPFDFLHPFLPEVVARRFERIGEWIERVPVIRQIAGSLLITARKP